MILMEGAHEIESESRMNDTLQWRGTTL